MLAESPWKLWTTLQTNLELVCSSGAFADVSLQRRHRWWVQPEYKAREFALALFCMAFQSWVQLVPLLLQTCGLLVAYERPRAFAPSSLLHLEQ